MIALKLMKEALLYQKLGDRKVKCQLCNHGCTISPGNTGICGVRENKDGTLYALNYGLLIASHVDPIEKKPFYHFLPGTSSFSIATAGCNFSCQWCQNAEISQLTKSDADWQKMSQKSSPAEIVEKALETDCASIAYTYTEPTIFFELALDTMKLAKKKDLKNVWVSNGFFSKKAFNLLKDYLDAINIDLKGFREEIYQKYCGARLTPVKENLIRISREDSIHLEVTSLIISGINDSDKELTEMAKFVKSLGTDIPWHLSRFYPAFKMSKVAPTPSETLEKAALIGKRVGLKNIHLGNL